MRKVKRILAAILAMAMMLSLVPLTAFAANEYIPSSVEIGDISIIEHTNGYVCVADDGNEWWKYYDPFPVVTVNFADGHSEEISGSATWGNYVDDDTVEWYHIDYTFETPTEYGDNWEVGSTHKAICTIAKLDESTGEFKTIYETTFNVTIIENPIKSITYTSVMTAYKGLDSSIDTNWETGEDFDRYHVYLNLEPENIVTNGSDSFYKDTNDNLCYKGNIYSVDDNSWSDQYENHWLPDNTYTVNASFAGVDCSYDVVVKDNPIDRIEVSDVILEEGSCWEEHDAEGRAYTYYYGYWPQNIDVYFKDGTSVKVNGNGYDFNGKHYYFNVYDPQSYDNQLAVGETMKFPYRFMGYEGTYNVTLYERSAWNTVNTDTGIAITGRRESYEDSKVTLPTTLFGRNVESVDLSYMSSDVEELVIPDGITKVSIGYGSNLKKLSIGKDVKSLELYGKFDNLTDIEISKSNTTFTIKDGLLYNKVADKVVFILPNATGTVIIPTTAENLDGYATCVDEGMELVLQEGSLYLTQEDGVIYSKDKSQIFYCSPSKSGSYKMPETVTSMAYKTFVNCSKLTDVEISSNVTCITYAAFANCTSLKNVTIPGGVRAIESYAFNGCTSLESASLPNTVLAISDHAFSNTGIKTLKLSDKLEYIPGHAFSYCRNLKAVELPDAVTSIGYCAFLGSGLTNINFSKNLLQIDDSAFSSTKLTSVVIPENVEVIYGAVFKDCINLESVTIKSNISSIPGSLFYGCASLKEVNIPDTVKSIGWQAFYGCKSLKSIDLPFGLETINGYAFQESGLESIDIPCTVTSLQYKTFYGSSNLKEINLPDSVVELFGHDFDNTAWYAAQPNGATYIGTTLYDYKGTAPSSVVVKDGTINISGYAFADEPNLSSVTLPEGLLFIGNSAFTNCPSLKTIYIPKTVERVDGNIIDYISSYNESGQYVTKPAVQIVIDPDNPYIELNENGYIQNKHNFTSERIVDVPATTTSTGLMSRHCTDPGFENLKMDEAIIPMLATETVVVEAKTETIEVNVEQEQQNTVLETANTLLTNEEKQQMEEGAQLQTFINVEEKSEDKIDKNVVEDIAANAAKEGADVQVYVDIDLSYKVGDGDEKPITDLGKEEVEVKVELPQELRGADQYVVVRDHVDKNGKHQVSVLDDDDVILIPDGNILIKSSKFSTFAIATIDVAGNVRAYGGNRYKSSLATAERLKKALGVDKFENIVVATGTDFADALAGSYLAAVKHAPIVMIDAKMSSYICNYIISNMSDSGTLYILGGESAVSKAFEDKMAQEFGAKRVKRLAGKNRYATNIEILKECNVKSEDLLFCDGQNFADALSASSLGKPIFLLNTKKKVVTDEQKAYLKTLNPAKIHIIGGTTAVPDDLANAAKALVASKSVSIDRVAGKNRYKTSRQIAEELFKFAPGANKTAVIATGEGFADGLCGGPLAYALGAPLILTSPKSTNVDTIKGYVSGPVGIERLVILGGTNAVSNATVLGIKPTATKIIEKVFNGK